MRPVRSGFAIDFADTHAPSSLLCEGQYEGPARIRAERWDSAQFAISAVAAFHRSSGLLEGGTLVLAAFVFLVALINREWIYVLFAGWLVANFQLAAISAGFDWTWFGQAVPESLILPMRKAAIAAYCLLTIALFGRLFSADLKQVRERWMLVPVQWSGILLMVPRLWRLSRSSCRSCGLRSPSACRSSRSCSSASWVPRAARWRCGTARRSR